MIRYEISADFQHSLHPTWLVCDCVTPYLTSFTKSRACFLIYFCLTSIVSSTHEFPVFESCSASVNCCYVGFYETLSWLCYSVLGKILNDDQPLSEYKIDEKGFVVVMVTKVKNFFCCSGISPLGHLFWKDTSIHGTQNLVWRDAHIISVSVTSVEVQGKEPLFWVPKHGLNCYSGDKKVTDHKKCW